MTSYTFLANAGISPSVALTATMTNLQTARN